MPGARFLLNSRRQRAARGLFDPDELQAVDAFFTRTVPRPTPLHCLPGLAGRLGLGSLLVKDDSGRFGLNAFKVLGVRYAVARLRERDVIPPHGTIVAATSGNHGRAVARVAAEERLHARIYVPAQTEAPRRTAIASEGAEVVVVEDSYEATVRRAAEDARRHGWPVISDVSWDGYEEIPRLIMAGYTRLMSEAERQWAPGARPDVVIVQAGVGGLACAVASWLAARFPDAAPTCIVAEPADAACALESVAAGRPVALAEEPRTLMAGLRCAEISPMTWPVLRDLADAFIAVPDGMGEDAMRLLAGPVPGDPSIRSGISGACGLAALLGLRQSPDLRPLAARLPLGTESRVLVIVTEGPTDPAHFDRVLAAAAPAETGSGPLDTL